MKWHIKDIFGRKCRDLNKEMLVNTDQEGLYFQA